MPPPLPSRPIDATLSVTKAARVLGVHPNTVRAWSDAGRLRYYRINPRGDRRYRLGDLQRFLSAAEGAQTNAGPSRPAGPGGGRHEGTARSRPGQPGTEASPELDEPRRALDLTVLGSLARLGGLERPLTEMLREVVQVLRDAYGRDLVTIFAATHAGYVARASVGAAGPLMAPPSETGAATAIDRPIVTGLDAQRSVVIPGPDGPWGRLVVASREPFDDPDDEALAVIASMVGALVAVDQRASEVAHHLHRAEALQRVVNDIGSRLDLDLILSGLVDHAMVLFGGDRAAVLLRRRDGQVAADVSRNLSAGYLAAVRSLPPASIQSSAVALRAPQSAVRYRDDARGRDVRAAVVQEGFDTICSVPLWDGPELLGTLDVYHDAPHSWTEAELDTMKALATQAEVAIRTAQNFERMATWAAQLQSIQQLGTRLNRHSSVTEIGLAIGNELRELIDYHNVRVYRQSGEDLVPVAISGQIGIYADERPEQLAVKVGEGITGWVALHRTAQSLPDAACDPRTDTIPGTEDDLDESMLLAPMIFEDEVLGVLVLSKLGLHQFTDDDLRLLVIYASFAAQAMANADATERLRAQSAAYERQVRSQRALLQITESMLTTHDGRAVLEGITDRLGVLIESDNIAIEVVDPGSGLLQPLTARGVDADYYMEPWAPGETGLATWVVEHNEPVYVADERTDERVNHFRATGVQDGSLMVVPLRGRDGAIGVLTLERLGAGASFTEDEFELVQLFAAQVSIALQNAEVYRAIEVRARSDDLTGLYNHGTFQEWLARWVAEGTPFSIVMVDLDDFRDVNNRYGHQAGDTVLRRIATALRGAGRDTDLVFRYGGDEFVLLLPNTDSTGAMRVASRVRAAVASIAEGDAGAAPISVSASVGVASFPDDGGTAAQVLLAADRACYVAKRTGRDRIATAEEGLALAAEFSLQAPTPVDPPSAPAA
jgi:diguanylate cyclase (GGDEF)-like protein/excisionase family DNA binding protein